MAMPKEYQEYLRQNVNLFSDSVSQLIKRQDYTNMLLGKILERLGGAPQSSSGEFPEWATLLISAVNNLNRTLGGSPTQLNPSSIASHEKIIKVAGTAEQLPSNVIPFGMSVAIKAIADNTGTIYIGRSKSEASDHTTGYPLEPGESIAYQISNTSIIWVDVLTDSDGIVWTVEQLA